MHTVLIDAGPLIALFDRNDAYHEGMLDFIKKGSFRFVTTLAVITEVSYMLDFNQQVRLDFFEWVMREGVRLHDIVQGDIPRIIHYSKKYADLPMDFADATLVVAAEKSGIKKILSVDKDFEIYRLPGREKIVNLCRDIL